MEGRFMLSSFLPALQVSIFLKEKPDRTRETYEGPLRQNWSLGGVLRQVSAAMARGDGQTGLG